MSKTRPSDYTQVSATLDNGMPVVAVRLPHLHSAQVSLLARVGSRHESPEDNGLSHMLEHMFFRGCDGYASSIALNAAMEDLGGHLEGYTTRDHTGYSVVVHPRHVGTATRILGAMVSTPRFDEIDVERRIILEEMLDGLDERGREIEIDTLAHRAHFGEHGLARPIEGPRKNVRRFSLDDLHRHRRRYYGARNLVLCFTGAVDLEDCLRTAEEAFLPLEPGEVASDGEPPHAAEPKTLFRRTDDAQTRLRLSFRTVSDGHGDHPALVLLRRLLDGGLSARLPAEMVERRGLVYEVFADHTTYADTGTFDIELAVAHRRLAVAITALGDVLYRLQEVEVAEEELARVKDRVAIAVEFGLDSVSEMTQWLGVDHLFGRALGPRERLALLSSVTPEDVTRAARVYLSSDRMTAAAVGGAGPQEARAGRRALARLQLGDRA